MGSTCCSNFNKEKSERLIYDTNACEDKLFHTFGDLEISEKITNLKSASNTIRATSSSEFFNYERNEVEEKLIEISKKVKAEAPIERKNLKLIRLQAFIKGYLIRRKTKKNKVRFRITIPSSKGSDKINTDKLSKASTIKSAVSQKDFIESSDVITTGNPSQYLDNIRRFFDKVDFSDSKDLLNSILENTFSNNNKSIKYYHGQWLNSKFDGFGILSWTDNSSLKGYFRYGAANGIGRFNHANGDYYLGEWVNDRVNGIGLFKSKNNNTFLGEWRNDKQKGFGTETWKDGNYSGEYNDGVKSGIGTLTLNDISKYEGEFRDNHIEGVGKMIFKDGRAYMGNWKNNKMSGYGIMTWFEEKGKSVLYRHSISNKEMKFYEGEFYDDAKHGAGVMYKDGKYYIGVWNHNKLEGEVLVIDTKKDKNGIMNNLKNSQYKNGKHIRDLETKSSYLKLAVEMGYIKNIF